MAGSDHTTWVMQSVDDFEARLLRYAGDLVGATLARDVVQDTFLKLCDQERERIESHLAAWLFTVCRNRALELRRKRERNGPTDREPPAPSLQSPDVAFLRKEAIGLVRELLRTLPERERELVRLKFDCELSYQEIAQVTGLSVTNVGFILHGAVKRLRERLAAQETRATPARGRPR